MTIKAQSVLFVSGNAHKHQEMQRLFHPISVDAIHVELPEIQTCSSVEVVHYKLQAAIERIPYTQGALLVEDTSLSFGHEHAFPGALMKFVLQAYSLERIYEAAKVLHDLPCNAFATCAVALQDHNQSRVVSATIPGTIVAPRGVFGFGWDAIFQPHGSSKTFAEMLPNEKDMYSARGQAIQKLILECF